MVQQFLFSFWRRTKNVEWKCGLLPFTVPQHLNLQVYTNIYRVIFFRAGNYTMWFSQWKVKKLLIAYLLMCSTKFSVSTLQITAKCQGVAQVLSNWSFTLRIFPCCAPLLLVSNLPISLVNMEKKENWSCYRPHCSVWFFSSAVPVLNPGFIVTCLFKTDNYYAINFLSWKPRYMQSHITSHVQSRNLIIQDPSSPHLFFLCNGTKLTSNIWVFSYA